MMHVLHGHSHVGICWLQSEKIYMGNLAKPESEKYCITLRLPLKSLLINVLRERDRELYVDCNFRATGFHFIIIIIYKMVMQQETTRKFQCWWYGSGTKVFLKNCTHRQNFNATCSDSATTIPHNIIRQTEDSYFFTPHLLLVNNVFSVGIEIKIDLED